MLGRSNLKAIKNVAAKVIQTSVILLIPKTLGLELSRELSDLELTSCEYSSYFISNSCILIQEIADLV